MNRVSASALDLLASALAAIILLYIVTLQEILLYPPSIDKKETFIHIQSKSDTCVMGVLLRRKNATIFPFTKTKDIRIVPQKMGSPSYKIYLSTGLKKSLQGKLIVSVFSCREDTLPTANLMVSIDIIGATVVPRLELSFPRNQTVMELRLPSLMKGLGYTAWQPYQPFNW